MKPIDLFGYGVILFAAVFISAIPLAFWDYRVATIIALVAFFAMNFCGRSLQHLSGKSK